MAFQFLCPQGHLLEGDESHMGMTTRCPHCGMTFIIPTIEIHHVEPEPEPEPEPTVDVYSQPYVPDPEPQHAPAAAEADEPFDDGLPGSNLLDELPGGDGLLESSAAHIVHIPCPNGHELETPFEMIGQEVLCPHCGAQFRLRNEDSLEYRAEHDKILSRRARIWFNWAIAAAVFVGVGLLAMIIYVFSSL